jgi:short chain dehydrogenase
MKGMAMKTCIITGGNSGIGKAAATQIAREGYRVIIGCRNAERGNKALKEIQECSGNRDIELVLMDLSSKGSIVATAKSIREKYKTIDVLIHNAADFDISRKAPLSSPDGTESIWATNHIGPVYLTSLLLDQLKSAEQLKESPVTVNCIRVTNVKIDMDRYPNISKLSRLVYKLKSKTALSAEEMARTYTFLATAPEMATTTGGYFDEKNRKVGSSKYSLDPERMDQVMELSMKYIK